MNSTYISSCIHDPSFIFFSQHLSASPAPSNLLCRYHRHTCRARNADQVPIFLIPCSSDGWLWAVSLRKSHRKPAFLLFFPFHSFLSSTFTTLTFSSLCLPGRNEKVSICFHLITVHHSAFLVNCALSQGACENFARLTAFFLGRRFDAHILYIDD